MAAVAAAVAVVAVVAAASPHAAPTSAPSAAEITDGCGATLACGDCASGETCGGGGPNLCGTSVCHPLTCAQLGAACGQFSDGCAGVVDCGPCACTPTTCAATGACGIIDDGCGHSLNCGSCAGSPWTAIGGLSSELRRVFFSSSGLWIVDSDGNVLHGDGAGPFTSQKVQSNLTELYVDGNDVWVGGVDGTSRKDPAASTFTMLSGAPAYAGGIHGAAGIVYVATYNTVGGIYRFNGTTWAAVPPTPAPGPLNATFVRSTSEAFVVGTNGAIYYTADSGTSWAKQSSGVTVGLAALFATPSTVLVTGQGGTILRSTNSGATWTRIASGTTVTLYGDLGQRHRRRLGVRGERDAAALDRRRRHLGSGKRAAGVVDNHALQRLRGKRQGVRGRLERHRADEAKPLTRGDGRGTTHGPFPWARNSCRSARTECGSRGAGGGVGLAWRS